MCDADHRFVVIVPWDTVQFKELCGGPGSKASRVADLRFNAEGVHQTLRCRRGGLRSKQTTHNTELEFGSILVPAA
jgi:hypothetical protein